MDSESKLRDDNLAAMIGNVDKSLGVKLDSIESESKLRDESLAKELRSRDELMMVKLEALSVKMDAQYQSLLYNLNRDKRVGLLERDKQSTSAQ